MADVRPLWRQVFDGIERAVGGRLESVVARPDVNELLAVAVRFQVETMRAAGRLSARALHFWNLPAYTDVRRLSRQLGQLEHAVRALSKRLDGADERPR